MPQTPTRQSPGGLGRDRRACNKSTARDGVVGGRQDALHPGPWPPLLDLRVKPLGRGNKTRPPFWLTYRLDSCLGWAMTPFPGG